MTEYITFCGAVVAFVRISFSNVDPCPVVDPPFVLGAAYHAIFVVDGLEVSVIFTALPEQTTPDDGLVINGSAFTVSFLTEVAVHPFEPVYVTDIVWAPRPLQLTLAVDVPFPELIVPPLEADQL